MSENICLSCRHIAVRDGEPWCRLFNTGLPTTVTACSMYQSLTEHMKQQETKEEKPLDIIGRIGTPAALEQLAEECAELGQAALKLARFLRGQNPTRKTKREIQESLQEEVADVLLCIELIQKTGVVGSPGRIDEIMTGKYERWIDSLSEVKK